MRSLMRNRAIYHRIALSVACGTLALAGISKADSTAVGDAPSDTNTSDAGLQEITVTAQRRSENLQKVPISITVLSSTEIAKQNIVAPEDLNSHVPSLSVGSVSVMRDSAIYQIRGACGQQRRISGRSDMIVHHANRLLIGGQAQHQLNEVTARRFQSTRAKNS